MLEGFSPVTSNSHLGGPGVVALYHINKSILKLKSYRDLNI